MQRRSFIKNSSVFAISVSAFGAISWNGKNFEGDTPTTTDILGPFYRPGAPMRSNIIPAASKGIPLELSGTIFKEDGKTGLKNAFVEIWQCDENEHYDNVSDDFLFRGAVITGKDGKYSFKTVIPVPYKADQTNDASWRPAHIHMRVSSESQQDLITQIYFKGDKYISKDVSASAPQSVNRILDITKNASNESVVRFDIIMNKTFPLDAAVYKKITGLYQMEKDIFEFVQNDDLLFLKRNGQLVTSFRYIGNNTFEAGIGAQKLNFELLPNERVKATVITTLKTYTGEKFLKYKN